MPLVELILPKLWESRANFKSRSAGKCTTAYGDFIVQPLNICFVLETEQLLYIREWWWPVVVGSRWQLLAWCCCCSVTKSCPTLCDSMDCSMPGFPVHCLPELAQTHVHWVNDTIQPSHPLLPPSAPALNISQHKGLFQWVCSSHHVARVLEIQLQHQSFQWVFRIGFL